MIQEVEKIDWTSQGAILFIQHNLKQSTIQVHFPRWEEKATQKAEEVEEEVQELVEDMEEHPLTTKIKNQRNTKKLN